MTCKSIISTFHSFLNAANFFKKESRSPRGFLPKPLLLRLRHPNSKKISRVFCEILSPKNSFRKTESALVPPPAQKLLGQNTKEKCPFLFRRNWSRANPKSKEHFFLVSAEALRGELSAKAPLGYFNEPRLRTIEPDKKTFNKVKETLRAFAIGNYTLTQIQSKMFSLGLVGPRSGKKMPLSSVEHIFKNPFFFRHFFLLVRQNFLPAKSGFENSFEFCFFWCKSNKHILCRSF